MGHFRTEPVVGDIIKIGVAAVVGDALQLPAKVVGVAHHLVVRVGDRLYPPPTVVSELCCKCYGLREERQGINPCLIRHLAHIAVLIAHNAALIVEGIEWDGID